MCAPWKDSDEEFLRYMMERALRRRARDEELLRNRDMAGRFGVRRMSDLCYAINLTGDEDFVGYSGLSGGLTGASYRGARYRELDDGSRRRIDNFAEAIGSSYDQVFSSNNVENRPICNCEEARALQLAQECNVPVHELFFITFYPDGNRPKNPCRNCLTWLAKASGYWSDGRPTCNGRKRDPDDDGNRRRLPGTASGLMGEAH